MKHTWIRQPDQFQQLGGTRKHKIKVWVCSVCGCEKSLCSYKFAEPDFERNGQLYNHYIECVDEKAEMLKTID